MRRANNISALLTLSVLTLLFTSHKAYGSDSNERTEPLLTIGCLTDLHCEYSLLSCSNVEDVQLRSTVLNALNKIREEEDIDILLLGGDYTSLVTTTQKNWLRARQLLVEATRDVFHDRSQTPVVYVNGNHEYEVPNANGIPKSWNSGDYYTYPMSEDIGTLSEDECFYEDADNGKKGKMSLLAAYHYNIKGVDFVVLNTAKYLFASSGNYSYSLESVEWCGKKIESLYNENPDRLVFFLAHIPFGDSNSISSPDKGLNSGQASTARLKEILSKYPQLVMLYGHDHGGDKAYTREKSSQRITRYDTYGNVISAFDSTHVDGVVRNEDETKEKTMYSLHNLGNGRYIGRDGQKYFFGDDCDLNLLNTPQPLDISMIDKKDGLYRISITHNGNTLSISCGSGGNMSVKDNNASSGNRNGRWYHVEELTGNTVLATRTSKLIAGEQYIIVYCNSSGGGNGEHDYYMLGNSLVPNNSYKRLASMQIDRYNLDDNLYNLTVTDKNIRNYIYTLEKYQATPSFFSVFMGSMRYYDNSIDKKHDESKEIHNPTISQVLMIYIYTDRMEFRIKNCGASGKFGTIRILEEPEPYTVFRDFSNEPNITGIHQLEMTPASNSDEVYDISGHLIPDGIMQYEGGLLPKGVYIVSGQQVLVRSE